jgi:peptidoglycan/xylan/chitin deacetylase (PgdA/CDA1 family)
VLVGAVIVGALLGAAQNGDDGSRPEAGSVSTQQPSDQSSGGTAVRSTLPEQPDSAAPRIALTFDDGPHPRWTPQVLDVLARHDATATFCVVGEQVAGREQLIERIQAEGHVLCNHTAGHDYALPARDPQQVQAEIEGVNALLRAVVPDASVTAFRAPGGRFSPEVVAAADSLGLDSWLWSVDSQDWRTDDPDEIVARVLDRVAPDAVVLLHDGGGARSATVAALEEIVPVLSSVGYEFVGLPDIP